MYLCVAGLVFTFRMILVVLMRMMRSNQTSIFLLMTRRVWRRTPMRTIPLTQKVPTLV